MTRVLGIDSLVNDPGNFLQIWMKAYISSWLVAYPILLLIIPVVQRVVLLLAARLWDDIPALCSPSGPGFPSSWYPRR